jgi:AraC-like DNA-binding protein
MLIINEVVANNRFLVNLCEVLYPYLSGKMPTIAFISQLSDMSVRSFQRYLKSQGFVYSQLVLDLKLATAQFMFVEEKRCVAEVAGLLGYPYPNHLSRAFKMRYGVTPKQIM